MGETRVEFIMKLFAKAGVEQKPLPVSLALWENVNFSRSYNSFKEEEFVVNLDAGE